MKPQFSVIIPTLHEESALDGTLRSLSCATNGHSIETIVVDGGSTDRTLDIASRYTGNIHVLKERGIALARNFGASCASGDILVFLDSDTKVPGDFFDELSRIFRNPGVSGASCNVMPCPTSKPSRNEKLFYRMWGKTRNVFYRMKPCGTGDNGIIVRSCTFNKAGGFDESMNTMEDLDFIFRASKLGKFLFLKDLTLTESMRRIRKEGLTRFSAIYVYNFLYYLVKRKPRVSQWEPIR
jgi:glycosyltransferase involved in cell wall biosynthesis